MQQFTILRRAAVVVAVVVSVFAVAAGGGSESPKSSDSAAAAGSLTIKSFVFSPNPLNAKAGDTITVTNNDGTDHQVVADDNSFDTGRFSSGTKTFTVSKAGTIPFHCEIHDYMTGAIQVAAP